MQNGYDKFFKEAKGKTSGTPPKRKKNRVSKKPVRQRGLVAKKRKSNPPLVSLSLMALGLAIALGGLVYIDELDTAIDSIQIGAFSPAIAADEKQEKAAESKDKKAEESAAATKSAKKSTRQQVAEWNEKDLSFLNKLSDRKEELDRREKELEIVEQELQRQKAVLDRKIVELTKVRDEISKILKSRIDLDDKKINKLVEFYSNMKPQQAAQVFAEINEDLAVEVLGRMKKQNAAAILNLLKSDKAQVLSEKFTGYRQPGSE